MSFKTLVLVTLGLMTAGGASNAVPETEFVRPRPGVQEIYISKIAPRGSRHRVLLYLPAPGFVRRWPSDLLQRFIFGWIRAAVSAVNPQPIRDVRPWCL